MRDLRAHAAKTINEWEDISRSVDFERGSDEVCLATFWRQATLGVSYYRCLLPARHLPGQMLGFDIVEVGWDDEHERLLLPRSRGVAVWSFLGDDARARVALAWQDLGHRTLMECDDNYTVAPGKWGINWAKTHKEAQGIVGYSHEQNRHIAGLVNGIIVSTPYLADVYAEFNDQVFVCRNSIDPADWEEPEKPDDGVLRIVFAGSNVHVFDFPLARKALKWAARQPNTEVTLWGFDQPPAWGYPMGEWVNSLEDFRKGLGRYDIGIAPLQNTTWNKAKSDIKALEYAMAGALPIVARTEAYAPWWRDLNWPYVAQTEDEWAKIIRHLVSNYDEVLAGAAAAKQYVLEQRTIKHEIIRWEEAIFGG